MTTNPLRATIRDAYGRVVYTHKTHEKAREICSRRATAVKWINITLTALTSGGIVAAGLIGDDLYLWTSAALATGSLAFNIFQLSFDPAASAARHRTTARSLIPIRDRYINLLTDLADGVDGHTVRSRRDALERDLYEIYQHAPDTNSKAYDKAQKALKINEEMTLSDKEINQFLPRELHVGDTEAEGKN